MVVVVNDQRCGQPDGTNCVIGCVNKQGQSRTGGLPTLGRNDLDQLAPKMSAEPEDSKPKLNLIINHSGTRTSSLVSYRR